MGDVLALMLDGKSLGVMLQILLSIYDILNFIK